MDDLKAIAERIRNECHSGDTEGDHALADDLLIEALEAFGRAGCDPFGERHEVIEAYGAVKKWFA